jgi:hypothetical protein
MTESKKKIKTKAPKLKVATNEKGAMLMFSDSESMRGFPVWVPEKGYELSPGMKSDNDYFLGRAKGLIGPPTNREDLVTPNEDKESKGNVRVVDGRKHGGRVHAIAKDLPEHVREIEEERQLERDLANAKEFVRSMGY